MSNSLAILIRHLSVFAILLSVSHLTCAQTPYEEGWRHFSSGNYAIARNIWLPLAEDGDADAALGLAIIYENGLQTKRDPGQSTRWYQVAADKGIPEAQHDLGIKYFKGSGIARNYRRAFELWQAAAETGLGSAQTKVAYLYLKGLGTDKDESEALRWYRQAAKQGNKEGMYNLSLMYKRGSGTEVNTHQFQYWLKEAAELDYAAAQYDLGLLKLHGKDMERDVAEGKQWLIRASNNGDINAQYYLGTLLLSGHILKQDRELAEKLLNAAAKRGHQGAKQSLVDISIMKKREAASGNDVAVATEQASPASNAQQQSINRSEILNSVVLNESLVGVQQPKPARETPQDKPAPQKPVSWLFQQNASAYTIQLLSSKDQGSIKRFLKGVPAAIKTYSYKYLIKGETWTAIATGIYSTRQEANLAVKTLPASLKKTKPWVRNIGSIQKLAAK